MRYKQRAVIEFLVFFFFFFALKESARDIQKCLLNVYGNATVDRISAGRWEKRVTAIETGKAELNQWFMPLGPSCRRS